MNNSLIHGIADIYVAPKSLFDTLPEKKGWSVLAFLTLLLMNTGIMYFFYAGMSPLWLVEQQLSLMAHELTPAEIGYQRVSAITINGKAQKLIEHETILEVQLTNPIAPKTSAKLSLMDKAGIPYISLLTDPTTGGVTASYAMLGDINIAEPGALIAFAGPRVVRDTTGKDLPDGFQTSEFLLEHGFLDFISHRKELKDKINLYIDLILNQEIR